VLDLGYPGKLRLIIDEALSQQPLILLAFLKQVSVRVRVGLGKASVMC
jgi:hypothetical protein